MLAIFIAALQQSKTEKHDSIPDVWKTEAQMKGGAGPVRGGGAKVSEPVKEEDSSDHLVGIGPGPSSPHLLPIQDIEHTLPKENQNLQLRVILAPLG